MKAFSGYRLAKPQRELSHELTKTLIVASVLLPAAATLIAWWGSTWGWNPDGKLAEETLSYLGASFALFLIPCLAVYRFRSSIDRIGPLGHLRPGLLVLGWGVYVTVVSALLTHAFDSEALWFGSVSISYVGFATGVLGVIRALAN